MRENTSLDATHSESQKRGTARPIVLLILGAQAIFYFASSLYLPFDLGELFLLGYVLVLADSGLVVFLGIKLFGEVLSSCKPK